jgi:low temperature requirement protein LtrA
VSAAELFFDLIFVAVVIEIGLYLKKHVDWSGCATTFGLFAVFWLTWLHTNLLLTRFHMRRTRAVVVFCIILTSLLVAIHAAGDGVTAVTTQGDREKILTVYLILMSNRAIFLVAYVSIFFVRKETRPMLLRYIIGLTASCILLTIGGVINVESTSVYFAVGAILAELLMYPFALSIKEADKLAVNNEHLLERNHLWVILILGESIISLITTEHESFEDQFYTIEILGLTLVYFILLIHTKSKVFLRDVHGIEYRAVPYFLTNLSLLIMTSGLLGVGVSLKLMVLHSADGEYSRTYAFLHTGALFLVFAGDEPLCVGRLPRHSRPHCPSCVCHPDGARLAAHCGAGALCRRRSPTPRHRVALQARQDGASARCGAHDGRHCDAKCGLGAAAAEQRPRGAT